MIDKMTKMRSLFHDLLNSLAIAHGMSETLKKSLNGQRKVTPEIELEKLEKSLKAMKKMEEQIIELRNLVKDETKLN
jgi:hypothetical protein